MASKTERIGWIGMGRMGYPMAERLVNAGWDVTAYNRTRAKAEPIAKVGGKVVDTPAELAQHDIVFSMVSTGDDVEEVYFGKAGVASRGGKLPRIFVDCSTIGVEESAALRQRLEKLGAQYVAAPVSGNGSTVRAGKLSSVISGPEAACAAVKPMVEAYAPRGVTYVGEGELSRICKIAHNVMLGVVIQNLAEITILANKAGVPRHAFLEFMSKSAMGSVFTTYKSPALVNLDWTTTFTPLLLLKDMDLGLEAARELGVPMPVTATTREEVQRHIGNAVLQPDPKAHLEQDFAKLIETVALGAGMKLVSENKKVASGLE
jgi:3-hydroxyisobutyrate dehydrogenase